MDNERKNHGLLAISQTVMPLVKKALGKKGLVEADVLLDWEKIAGAELAVCSQPERIEFKKDQRNEGILHLRVSSGAHALEIKHKEKIILEKINAYFGYKAVAGLRIMQSPEFLAQQNVEVKDNKAVVSPEEESYIRQLAIGVENNELRETLERLGKNIIRDHKK